MLKIDFTAPHVNIKFTSVDGDNFEVKSKEFGGDVISLTTEKTMGDPAGTFKIELVARGNYLNYFSLASEKKKAHAYDIFKPASLIDIDINDQENMLGTVDSVNKTVNFRGRVPRRTITITGRDFGSFLIDHKIWSDVKLNGGRIYNFALGKAMEALGIMGGEGPADLMMQAVNNWFIRVVNQKLPDFENSFKFVDGDKIQDKLICLTEITSEFDIKQDGTVLDDDENLKVEDGDSIGSVKGPGALSISNYGNYYPMSVSLWGFQGDLMTFCKSMVSYPFNEIWVETGGRDVVLGAARVNGDFTDDYYDANAEDGVGGQVKFDNPGVRKFPMLPKKAYLIFRPSPFDDDGIKDGVAPDDMESLLMMKDLISHKVDDSVIVSKSLNLSRNDIPSFYRVAPANALITGNAAKAFSPAEYDERALRRYGYVPLDIQLDSMDLGTKNFKKGGVQDISKRFQKKLKSWYQNSDRFLTGTMELKGNEKIRIGDRLDYERLGGGIEDEYEEGYYYITGVTQQYNFGIKYETRVTLDRGVSKKILGKK